MKSNSSGNKADSRNRNVLIMAATSDIGFHVARGFAERGFDLCITGRNQQRLSELEEKLKPTGVSVRSSFLDVSDFGSHEDFYDSLPEKPDIVVSCAGYYEDQQEARLDYRETVATINVNLTGLMTILNTISNDFEERKSGSIIVLGSVAGERGRQLNYIYGAAKAGMATYLSGLRNRLHGSGVSVTTIKLGPVYTRMSEGHNLLPVLTLSPGVAAEKIIKAGLKKKSIVISFGPGDISC